MCGMTREEHDVNVQRFCDMLKLQNLELNPDKSVIGVTEIQMLGYHISHGVLRPDPDRMEPLVKLPIPKDQKSLKKSKEHWDSFHTIVNGFRIFLIKFVI